MKELASQIFVGDKFPPNVYQDVENWQNSQAHAEQITTAIGEELPMPEAQKERIADVLDATKQYYSDRLDVNVSSRMPAMQNLHLLTSENLQKLREKFGLTAHNLDIYAFPVAERDMILRETEDSALSTYVFQHELGHVIGADVKRISHDGNGGVNVGKVRSGLGGKNVFLAVEEYTVEQTTRDIIENYWPKYASLKDLHPDLIAHKPSVELGQTIIKGLGYEPDEILTRLQRAQLTGDRSALEGIQHRIYERWGSEALRSIARVDLNEGAEDLAKKFAQDPERTE